MSKLKSYAELKSFRAEAVKNTKIVAPDSEPDEIVVRVGAATCGIAAGANEVIEAFARELKKVKKTDVTVMGCGCLGFCYAEPLVEVLKDNVSTLYRNVDEKTVKEIVDSHIMQGKVYEKALLKKEAAE